MAKGEVVCVTGASGAIGSWVVHLLLLRGYTVHATVQNLQDEKETKHLEALEGADTRLRLFQMDLLQYDTISAAISGCNGVIHLACPCIVGDVHDPQKQLLDPAIKGTINVLTAAKEAGVRRVVVTSSISSITPSPNWPADKIKNEECWTDEEYCRQNGLWYSLAKTLAEKATWEFAEEKGLDVVAVNPGTSLGPLIPPNLNSSMSQLLSLLQALKGIYVRDPLNGLNAGIVKGSYTMFLFAGCTETYENMFMGSVHFKDIATAHILLYEHPDAKGRHLCVESIFHFGDLAAKVAELFPEYNVPKLPRETQPGLLRAKNASKKLMDLGMEFIPLEQIIKDAVGSLKSKGFLA